MKVEGKRINDYLKFGKIHFIVLIAWSLLAFLIPYVFSGQSMLIAIATKMTVIAPIFMIAVFGHLGFVIAKNPKFGKANQAVSAGIIIGLITGFIAGFLMLYEPGTRSYIVNFLFEGEAKKGAIFLLALISGIVTSFLRAIYGAILCWIGASIITEVK
jgi:hypothetical protein